MSVRLCKDCKWGRPAARREYRHGGFLGFGGKVETYEVWETTVAWLPVEGPMPPLVHPRCAHPNTANPVNGAPVACEEARGENRFCGRDGGAWEPKS